MQAVCLDQCSLRPECVDECAYADGGKPVGAYVWSIAATLVLLCLSGFFSGLTLGLMSLDITGLELIIACGEADQQRWAKRILPLRRRGNLLLCTLLLGNTAVNSFIAIVTADLTAGVIGAVLSTAFILIFGEIIPQSVCSKYGLYIGALSVPIVRVFVVAFYPLAWPISLLLDHALGRELRTIYNRKELDKLLSIAVEDPHGDLREEERSLMTAALEFGEKQAHMIMTKLDHTFCIEVSSKLSFDALLRCYKSGFTRIPVFRRDPSAVVGLLFAKDLILVDPDDELPVGAMLSFCGRSVHVVRHDTTLDKLLTAAQTQRSHLFFVVNSPDAPSVPAKRNPPISDVIGIVTLEDVLEELINAEIVDETDTIRDNHSRATVSHNQTQRTQRMEFFYSIQVRARACARASRSARADGHHLTPGAARRAPCAPRARVAGQAPPEAPHLGGGAARRDDVPHRQRRALLARASHVQGAPPRAPARAARHTHTHTHPARARARLTVCAAAPVLAVWRRGACVRRAYASCSTAAPCTRWRRPRCSAATRACRSPSRSTRTACPPTAARSSSRARCASRRARTRSNLRRGRGPCSRCRRSPRTTTCPTTARR